MNRADIFKSVGGASPPRTAFDLSYEVKTTTDFSGLIPVQCDEVVPGDIWKMSVKSLIRMNPLAVPVMHGIKVSYHTFFVPYRLLWENWEEYITGGPQGDDTHTIPKVSIPPSANTPNPSFGSQASGNYVATSAMFQNSIWDYLGLPSDITANNYQNAYIKPIAFPIAAYDFIYYEYYRDQNYCNVTTLGPIGAATPGNNNAYWDKIRVQVDDTGRQLTRWKSSKYYTIPQLYATWIGPNAGSESPDPQRINTVFDGKMIWMRNRKKDYFNSVLPSQQRGIAPAFPLTGSPNLTIPAQTLNASLPISGNIGTQQLQLVASAQGGPAPYSVSVTTNPQQSSVSGNGTFNASGNIADPAQTIPIDLSTVTAVTVTELRDNIQLQKWLERAMRGGVRYTEWLKAMFGVNPRDDRLDRPEYIGGYKRDVLVTEVLQTSQTTQTSAPSGASALGDYGGHGISAGEGFIGTYKVQEFGLIMTLMSIMPDEGYEDQLNRQWIKFNRYDFYNPLFAHLSEEAVLNAEIRYNATQGANGTDAGYFGYQGIWNWMRFKPDMVTGKMRLSATTFSGTPPVPSAGYGDWQLCRHWAVGTVPVMNQTFLIDQQNWIPATGQGAKRCLAVPSEPAFIVNHRNQITAIRPMPFDAEPGMMDHF